MLFVNPFSVLAESVSPIFLQIFVIAMIILVIVGTISSSLIKHSRTSLELYS